MTRTSMLKKIPVLVIPKSYTGNTLVELAYLVVTTANWAVNVNFRIYPFIGAVASIFHEVEVKREVNTVCKLD